MPNTLVVVSGLPGTGKSTLADAAGRRLGWPVFSMDWVLGALMPFGILGPDNVAPVAYTLLERLARRQLMLDQSAIVECPSNALGHDSRDVWSELAAAYDASFRPIECGFSDLELHRTRVETRHRDIPGWPSTVQWDNVQRMRETYLPWGVEHLAVDAVDPADRNLDLALDFIGR